VRLVVISDIHIGSGRLDDCDAELEGAIINFLEILAKDTLPVELVINGDFLDFVQAEPWQGTDLESQTSANIPLCFTEEQSLEKLNGIVAAHYRIFDALNVFLSSVAEHKLVILPGNHDVDFFWSEIRKKFVEVVSKGDGGVQQRLKFHLQKAYQPQNFPGVWIEHGHQYDECNKFEVHGEPRWSEEAKPVFIDNDGKPRLLECVGTRFLIKFLNHLDAEYPFVDNVKPFSKFVKMFLVSSLVPEFGLLKAAVALWAFISYFNKTAYESPVDILGGHMEQPNPVSLFAKRFSALSPQNTKDLTSRLKRDGFDFKGMPFSFYLRDDGRTECLLDHICRNPHILDAIREEDIGYLSKKSIGGYLTLSSSYLKDETEELKAAAKNLLATESISSVIMGHTHEPVDPVDDFNYVNTGSWTRNYRDTKDQRYVRSWDLLRKSAYEKFPFELSYAQHSRQGKLILYNTTYLRGH